MLSFARRNLLVVLAIVLVGSSAVSEAQSADQNRAKILFFAAEDAYKAKNYDSAISALDQAEMAFGGGNALLSSLRVKVLWSQEKYTEAKTELDRFLTFSSSPELAREMSQYLVDVDKKIEAENTRIVEEDRAWAKAKELNTSKAYDSFYWAHTGGRYQDQAAQLRDQRKLEEANAARIEHFKENSNGAPLVPHKTYKAGNLKHGYVNRLGEIPVEYQYDCAEPFNDYGYAIVCSYEKQMIIDLNGTNALSTWQRRIYQFGNVFVLQSDSGFYTLYDAKKLQRLHDGDLIRFESLSFISEQDGSEKKLIIMLIGDDLARRMFTTYDIIRGFGRHGSAVIDAESGEYVIPFGTYSVITGGNYDWPFLTVRVIVDTEKQDREYLNQYPLRNIYALGLVDENGKLVVPLEYEKIEKIDDNSVRLLKRGQSSRKAKVVRIR